MCHAPLFICITLAALVCCSAYTTEVLSEQPKIIYVRDFLSKKECNYLMKLSQPRVQRLIVINDQTGNQQQVSSGRTSEGLFLGGEWQQDPIIRTIQDRVSNLTRLPSNHAEPMQVAHYGLGGEYRPHFDFFTAGTPGGEIAMQRGGQRTLTTIMYLNTPEGGGETIFPSINRKVQAIKGNAVIFHNVVDGKTDPLTFHGGAPVTKGEKWIVTRWFRERVFA